MLVSVLALVHTIGGLWAWYAGLADGWTACCGERGELLRATLGGQHMNRTAVGEWWRLATSVLLHVSLLHLLANAAALVVLGRLGEPLVGSLRWLGVFFAGGVVGSVGSALAGVVQSDGASGGAFACAGLLVGLGWRWRERLPAEDAWLLGPVLGGLVAVNFVVGALVPALDLAAHLGGLLVGLLAAGWVERGATFWWVLNVGFVLVVGYGWGGGGAW